MVCYPNTVEVLNQLEMCWGVNLVIDWIALRKISLLSRMQARVSGSKGLSLLV